jgi:hypothetical protein
MPSFSSIKTLEAFLQSKLTKAIKDSIVLDIKKLESKNVNEVVYKSYNPIIYQRDMDEGGLSDIDNMHHNVTIDGKSINLTISNDTMNNQDYNPNNKYPFEIAGLVEYGDNSIYGDYDYPFSGKDPTRHRYLNPRPFIQITRDELKNGKAREFFIKGLKKQGLNIE